jgi:hypothetical protein
MALRELAEREEDGILVQLLWDDSRPDGCAVFVEYRDERRGVYFTLQPPPEYALEAYRQPYWYLRHAGNLALAPPVAA